MLIKVNRLGPPLFRGHFQPLGHSIDGNDTAGAEHPSALDGELADWATSPDRDRIARLHLAIFRSHIAGRENIREKKNLVVAQAARNLNRADIPEWHAHVFRLPARKSAQHVRIPEESRGRMSHRLPGLIRVGIGSVTQRGHSLFAKKAMTA